MHDTSSPQTAARPMRRRDRAVTDPREIDALLDSLTCGHLALVDGGAPYGVTLNFGWEPGADGARILWFHAAEAGRKIDALRANPRVWFFADREGAFHEATNAAGQVYMTIDYESVAGAGTASFAADRAEKRHGLGVLCARFTQTPVSVIPDAVIDRTCVFKVVIPLLTAKRHARGGVSRPAG